MHRDDVVHWICLALFYTVVLATFMVIGNGE